MAININVGTLGADEPKMIRALWNLTNKVVLSQSTPLPGSPVDGDIYIVPSGVNAKQIAFRSEGAWLYLVPEAGWMVYVADDSMLVFYDGADWVMFEAPSSTTGVVELSLFAGGKLTASETIFRHEFTTLFAFPAGLVKSQGSSGVAAAATAVLSLNKNGTQFGTATWAAAGTNPTLAAATDTAFAISDVLTVTGPVTPDTTLADVALSLVGLIS